MTRTTKLIVWGIVIAVVLFVVGLFVFNSMLTRETVVSSAFVALR